MYICSIIQNNKKIIMEYHKREPEIYVEINSDFDGRELETTVEIEGTHYEVVYNQYGNQFEVLSAIIFQEDYPDQLPEFIDSNELYECIEDMLQYEFETNYEAI